jgi:alpha-ketoglutaric semialdehyde dehydrogenase
MPHWKREDTWLCVEGTPGVLPPAELQPLKSEDVFIKQFYSGFSNPALRAKLKDLAVDTIMIAGIYLHGCVRSTVLDAWQLGYKILVADDATDPANRITLKLRVIIWKDGQQNLQIRSRY